MILRDDELEQIIPFNYAGRKYPSLKSTISRLPRLFRVRKPLKCLSEFWALVVRIDMVDHIFAFSAALRPSTASSFIKNCSIFLCNSSELNQLFSAEQVGLCRINDYSILSSPVRNRKWKIHRGWQSESLAYSLATSEHLVNLMFRNYFMIKGCTRSRGSTGACRNRFQAHFPTSEMRQSVSQKRE